MAIQRDQIIRQLSGLTFTGNDDGLIPIFGVYANQLPVSLWNSFAQRLIGKVPSTLIEPAEYLLINAAHVCGYHTCNGIICSKEWKEIVSPMIEKMPEDMLYGMYAVLTAFGWGKSEIIELIPGERMVVRVYDYYEADAVQYGIASAPCAYMLRGINAAAMDLVYGNPYPNGMNTFECIQTKGIECKDEYGEFIVSRVLKK